MGFSQVFRLGVVLISLQVAQQCNGEFMRVSGQDLMYGSQKVFMSGVNIAWKSYGYDFGNGNYGGSGPTLEQWIRDIANNGGNTLRNPKFPYIPIL